MDLMSQLLEVGPGRTSFLLADDYPQAFAELHNSGLASADTGGRLMALPRAAEVVQLTQLFVSPVSISEYRSVPAPAEEAMSVLDIMNELADAGWQRITLQSLRKAERPAPFTPNAEKKFFLAAKSSVGRNYLLALWKSSSLFNKGVPRIHHFQAEGYYKALMECAPEHAAKIVPGQKADVYKEFRRGVESAHLDLPFREQLGDLDLDNDEEGRGVCGEPAACSIRKFD